MDFYLAHVGVNPENQAEAEELRTFLNTVLAMNETVETPLSWFAANGKIELMKEKGFGRKGHLAFYTSDMTQAVALLARHGYAVDMRTAKYDPDGSVRLVYIDHEINGFAIHLTTRK